MLRKKNKGAPRGYALLSIASLRLTTATEQPPQGVDT